LGIWISPYWEFSTAWVRLWWSWIWKWWFWLNFWRRFELYWFNWLHLGWQWVDFVTYWYIIKCFSRLKSPSCLDCAPRNKWLYLNIGIPLRNPEDFPRWELFRAFWSANSHILWPFSLELKSRLIILLLLFHSWSIIRCARTSSSQLFWTNRTWWIFLSFVWERYSFSWASLGHTRSLFLFLKLCQRKWYHTHKRNLTRIFCGIDLSRAFFWASFKWLH